VLEVDLLRDGQTCQQHQSPGAASDFGFCAGVTIIALLPIPRLDLFKAIALSAAAEPDAGLAISSGWRR
jgi:hypothetical protein